MMMGLVTIVLYTSVIYLFVISSTQNTGAAGSCVLSTSRNTLSDTSWTTVSVEWNPNTPGPDGRFVECATSISYSDFYEVELRPHNISARYACTPMAEEFVYIGETRNGERVSSCIRPLERYIFRLPVTIKYTSKTADSSKFELNFFKNRGIYLCDTYSFEVYSNPRILFGVYLIHTMRHENGKCWGTIDVPSDKVFVLQPLKNIDTCNGSLVISRIRYFEEQHVCLSGLETFAFEPLSYGYYDRMRYHFKHPSEFTYFPLMFKHWAISKLQDAIICRNKSINAVTINSSGLYIPIKVEVDPLVSWFCEIRLKAIKMEMAMSLVNVAPKARGVELEIVSGNDTFSPGCSSSPPLKLFRPRPGQDIKIRLCSNSTTSGSPTTSVIAFMADVQESSNFPPEFYAANDKVSDVWIPAELTVEAPLIFKVIAPSASSCLKFETRSPDGPILSSVAHLYAGNIYSGAFEFTRDCNDTKREQRVLYSNISDFVTVQINQALPQGFWLSFQVLTDHECPGILETVLTPSQNNIESLLPPSGHFWMPNTQCKWVLKRDTYDKIKFRAHIGNPTSVVLTVKYGDMQHGLINLTAPSEMISSLSQQPWHYSSSDIEVYAKISIFIFSESLTFEYMRVNNTDIEECSSSTSVTPPQTVFSPNYPDFSIGGSECQWKLNVTEKVMNYVYIRIKFRLLGNLTCGFHSYIRIYSETGSIDLPCNSLEYTATYKEEVAIEFFTGLYDDMPGFSFSITFTKCPIEPVDLTAYDHVQTLTSVGILQPYEYDFDCKWRITAERLRNVKILSKYLHAKCGRDFLNVYDGANTSSHRLASMCQFNFPPTTYTSSLNEMFIHFHTGLIKNDKMFILEYNVVSECGPGTLNAKYEHKYLYSPRYPKKYPKGTNCSWTMHSDLSETVQIEVLRLTVDWRCREPEYAKYLQIYDGANSSSPLIISMCDNENPDQVFQSTGQVVYISFITSKYSTDAGFYGFQLRYRSQMKKKSESVDGSESDDSSIVEPIVIPLSILLLLFIILVIVYTQFNKIKLKCMGLLQTITSSNGTQAESDSEHASVANSDNVDAEMASSEREDPPAYTDTNAPPAYTDTNAPPTMINIGGPHNYLEPITNNSESLPTADSPNVNPRDAASESPPELAVNNASTNRTNISSSDSYLDPPPVYSDAILYSIVEHPPPYSPDMPGGPLEEQTSEI